MMRRIEERGVLPELGIRTTYHLAVMHDRQDLPELAARLAAGFGEVINDEAPDAVIAKSDTTTGFSTAPAACSTRVPVEQQGVDSAAALGDGDLVLTGSDGHPVDAEQPVFVDATGRRRNLACKAGLLLGPLLLGYGVALGISLGASADVPEITWVDTDDHKPVPARSAKALATTSKITPSASVGLTQGQNPHAPLS